MSRIRADGSTPRFDARHGQPPPRVAETPDIPLLRPRSSTRPTGPVGPIACRACDLNEVCRLCGLIALEGRTRQPTGALRMVRPGAPLFRAGMPAHSLYAVRQGMLKTVRVTAEGDEQVIALNTPGEVLGLEAFGLGVYANDAIALQPVVCCELPLPLLGEQGSRVRELGWAIVRLLSQAAAPRPPLSRGSVRERVISFLLDLSSRMQARGFDGRHLQLGLTRQELAALLDTRIETVSRTLQQLHREHAIRVRGNTVTLIGLPHTEPTTD